MRVESTPTSETEHRQQRRGWQWLPSWRMVGLVAAILVIGEQFPFSYFPMYSSFDPTADYYYLANEEGEPLASVEVVGTSTANVKKMYRARLRELVVRRGAEEDDATEQERAQIGRETLTYLRELGLRSGAAVPSEPIVLQRVVLHRSGEGEITRQERVVASN